ncbi:protein TonB [Variovorax sp. OAS795]
MTMMNMRALAILAAAMALAGCSAFKPAEKTDSGKAATSAPDEVASPRSEVPTVRLITAQTPAVRAYRKTGARQIYNAYPQRIYKGKIPPLVYAVVVVETDLDANGNVKNVTFSRVPSHAPEVPPKIAELIKAASPLPSPGRLGGHTYVDTWLWDKSGNFQLDSLTLGQRSR